MKRSLVVPCIGTLFAAALFVAVAPVGLAAEARRSGQPDSLRARQEAQQRARGMARELISSILEIQLRQLRENGLEALPVYVEIRTMRKNIDGLVETEMREVVALLVEAQAASPADRPQLVGAARTRIRQIVVRLTEERQNLLRRLRIAEIAAQTRRLIELETVALHTTESLNEQPTGRREQLTLAAIEDQRDIQALYHRLSQTLVEVSSWGGTAGTGAADGLRIVKAARVPENLAAAGEHLEAIQFADASQSQRQVIQGLRALLEKIEETQGIIGSDHEAAIALIRELMKRQEQIREQTRAAPLNDRTIERLVERQSQLKEDLKQLNEAAAKTPPAQPLLERAKTAALKATASLFTADQQAAIREEGNVLGSLAELAEQLHSSPQGERNQSADELTRQLDDLKQAQQELAPARQRQQQAAQTAAENPRAAAQQEKAVSQAVRQIPEQKDLPAQVEHRLSEAAEAAERAQQALNDADQQLSTAAQAAAGQAHEAIERAASEIQAAIADTQRRQLTMELGELAHAAEAVERAAAAERNLSERAVRAANAGEPMPAAEAERASTTQQDVAEVARNVAEGVQHTAPEVARSLEQARQPIAATQQALDAAQQTPQGTERVAEQAAAAAEQLERAATNLRGNLANTTRELMQVAEAQLGEVTPAREAAESTLGNQPIREAYELASGLGGEQPGQPSGEADSEPSGEQGSQGQSSGESGHEPGGEPGNEPGHEPGQSSGESQGEGQYPSQPNGRGQQSSTRPGKTSPNEGRGGSTQSGQVGNNRLAGDRPLEQVEGIQPGHDGRTSNRGSDSTATARKAAAEPWFNRLPPNVRKAIRAKSQPRAPRGYEERLNRYFENID